MVDLSKLKNTIEFLEANINVENASLFRKVGAIRTTIEVLRETAHQLKKLEAIQVNDILS